MQRKFKESLLADDVVVISVRKLKSLATALRKDRAKEEAFIDTCKDEKLGERARGITIGLTRAINKVEALIK